MRILPIALLVLVMINGPLYSAPRLLISPEVYDFGEAPSGERIQALFTLRNDGDELLVISRIRASCGCTTTVLNKRQLVPGQETPLEATLSLKGRNGPQKKHITIVSNDPDQPSLKVSIQGTAIRHLLMRPSSIFFSSAPQGKIIIKTIQVLSENKGPFKILSIEASHPDLNCEVTPLSTNKYRLSLTLPPTWPAGRIDETLRIHTDHPNAPLLTCKIIGTLQPQEKINAPTP